MNCTIRAAVPRTVFCAGFIIKKSPASFVKHQEMQCIFGSFTNQTLIELRPVPLPIAGNINRTAAIAKRVQVAHN